MKRFKSAGSWMLAAMLGSALALGAVVAGPAGAASADAGDLALSAVGQDGGYFDLTLSPGQSVTLSVARTNAGTAPISALTYRANVYTVVNGGFGADTRGTAARGSTSWLSYGAGTFTLAAGEESIVPFTVAVPASAKPGDYLTGVVIENNVPEASTDSGQLALTKVTRHILAVSIRVPGAYVPAFSIGTPLHKTAAGHSIVGAAITNTGNRTLKPSGTIVVKNLAGITVSTSNITMDSFYPSNSTTVESTLSELLNPGEYTISMNLRDAAAGVSASLTDAKLTVAVPGAALAEAGGNPNAALPQVIQDALIALGHGPAFLPYLIIVILLAGLVAALVLLIVSRRRINRMGAAALAAVAEG